MADSDKFDIPLLPNYYWPANFHRKPLGLWPRWDQSNRSHDKVHHDDEYYEKKAHDLLLLDGCIPAYNIKEMSSVLASIPGDHYKHQVDAWIDEPLPGEGHEPYVEGRDYQPDGPGMKYTFRNQFKGWLQFRMWQESNRDYRAAKAKRYDDVVFCLVKKADTVAQRELSPEELQKAHTETKDQVRKEWERRSTAGFRNPKTNRRYTLKAIEEEQLATLVKLGHLPTYADEWTKVADRIFEDEVEGPHYQKLLEMAELGSLKSVEPGFMFDEPPRQGPYSGGVSRPRWGFEYFVSSLEDTLAWHIKDHHALRHPLPLSLALQGVDFDMDTWKQDQFSTWVEYVYYECRQHDRLQLILTISNKPPVMSDELPKILATAPPTGSSSAAHLNTVGRVFAGQAEAERQTDLYNHTLLVKKFKDQHHALVSNKKMLPANRHIEVKLREELQKAEKYLKEMEEYHQKLDDYLRRVHGEDEALGRALALAGERQRHRRNWAINEMFKMAALGRAGKIDLREVVRKTPPLRRPETGTLPLVPKAYRDRPKGPDLKAKNKTRKRKVVVDESVPRRKSRRLAGQEPEVLLVQTVGEVAGTAEGLAQKAAPVGKGGKGRRRPSKKVRMANPQR